MRAGILTSWRVPCGIYQYSARFADALAELGHTPVILAGRADEHRSVPEESPHEVHDVSTIGCWRDDMVYEFDFDAVAGLELDAVFVQYQSMLFRQHDLVELTRRLGPNVTTAVTFHDNCQRPDFPIGVFDRSFTHRVGVGYDRSKVIPFGVEIRPPVVRTFGLGRTRSDLIAPICERNGWVFESAASHEPAHGGGQAWQTHDELIAWLRGADVIVLWYDDNDMAGSSQAARTAMASRRPVITSDTRWFSEIPDWIPGVYRKCASLEALEELIRQHTDAQEWLRSRAWTSVAAAYVEALSLP